jgi:hypothetical protein
VPVAARFRDESAASAIAVDFYKWYLWTIRRPSAAATATVTLVILWIS